MLIKNIVILSSKGEPVLTNTREPIEVKKLSIPSSIQTIENCQLYLRPEDEDFLKELVTEILKKLTI